MADVKDMSRLKSEIEAAFQQRNFLAAASLLEQLLADVPRDAEALGALAFIRQQQGRTAEALELLFRAVEADPMNSRVRALLVDRLKGEQRFEEALEHLRKLPKFTREDFQFAAQEADMLGKLGRHDEEIDLYRKLIELRPDLPGLKVSLANALKTVGKTDEAIEVLRETTQSDPRHARAWWLLSDLKNYRFTDDEFVRLEKLVEEMGESAESIPLHFAFAKALEQRGNFEQAFRHYETGNRLDHARQPQLPSRVTEITDKAITTLNSELMTKKSGQGHDDNAPIFVVGIQRSGSTLVEQILASHPEVEGTTELPVMGQIGREIFASGSPDKPVVERIAELSPEDLQRLGKLYIERASAYRTTDRPHFIDKLPGNWRRIGLIRLILPNAKIIDVRRNPMASGWSNFTQFYGGGGDFTRDLAQFGEFYGNYLRLVEHFKAIDGQAIHTVLYERLVDDFETEVRKLLDFVGLDFDQRCLEFHRTRRAVRTPSAEQVRKPISRDAVDHWRHFETWLDPLKQGLGSALEEWDK